MGEITVPYKKDTTIISVEEGFLIDQVGRGANVEYKTNEDYPAIWIKTSRFETKAGEVRYRKHMGIDKRGLARLIDELKKFL